jgi:predicted metalloendopeptidase
MIDGMNEKDWITIAAIIIGPILAVQAQKILEALRYKKQRRLTLFHTLMSTRATRLSNEHVAALNMIDIEFYGRKIFGVRFQTPREKSVTNAWKNYNDHLNSQYVPEQFPVWVQRGEDLLTTLLYKMSNAFRI